MIVVATSEAPEHITAAALAPARAARYHHNMRSAHSSNSTPGPDVPTKTPRPKLGPNATAELGRTNALVILGRTNAPVTAGHTTHDSLSARSSDGVTDSSVTDPSVTDPSVTDSTVTDSSVTDSSVTDTRVTDSPSSMHLPWGREGQHSHTRADQLTANAFHQDSLHATGGSRYQRFNASAFQGSSITVLQRSSFSVSQRSLSSTTDSQSIRIHGPAKLLQHSSFNVPASTDQTASYQPHSSVARQTMPSILLNGNTDVHDTSTQRSTVISFHLNA